MKDQPLTPPHTPLEVRLAAEKIGATTWRKWEITRRRTEFKTEVSLWLPAAEGDGHVLRVVTVTDLEVMAHA